MIIYIAIGFFQGMAEEVLREYAFKKRFLFKWPVKTTAAAWSAYIVGTLLIFSPPLAWFAATPGREEWMMFYTPAWFVAVMFGSATARALLKPPQ